MRKIIESTLVLLDGVIEDPHISATPYFDGEAERYALKLVSTADAMLMGRRTYEFFPKYVGEADYHVRRADTSEITRGAPMRKFFWLIIEVGR